MKINGSETVPAERERLYRLLLNPDVLTRCLPGCQGLDKTGEDEYTLKMKAVLGSVSGLFSGKVRLADQQPPESFRMIVEGNGKIGFLKGEGVLTLNPSGSATEVAYEGDVQVGGTIASVGQRLLGTTTKMMIRRFFGRLEAETQSPRTAVE